MAEEKLEQKDVDSTKTEETAEEVVEDSKVKDSVKDIADEVPEIPVEKNKKLEDKSEEDKSEEVVADPNEGIFITEKDTFDVKIRWYKIDDIVHVDGNPNDTEFDSQYSGINEFTVTFKYPSQGDYEVIMNSAVYRSPDEMNVASIIQLELTRLVTLVRKWSLKQELSRMVELDPVIINEILRQVRNVIGVKAIL
ncbi:MAG: hypothetical protein WC119_01780 [Synergistaceae bacterium]